jgi:hypothetical protein
MFQLVCPVHAHPSIQPRHRCGGARSGQMSAYLPHPCATAGPAERGTGVRERSGSGRGLGPPGRSQCQHMRWHGTVLRRADAHQGGCLGRQGPGCGGLAAPLLPPPPWPTPPPFHALPPRAVLGVCQHRRRRWSAPERPAHRAGRPGVSRPGGALAGGKAMRWRRFARTAGPDAPNPPYLLRFARIPPFSHALRGTPSRTRPTARPALHAQGGRLRLPPVPVRQHGRVPRREEVPRCRPAGGVGLGRVRGRGHGGAGAAQLGGGLGAARQQGGLHRGGF